MENKEYNVVTIDGVEYTEISRLDNDGNIYVFLSNLGNPKDFGIRKLIKENDEDYLVELDNKEEFIKIFKLFNEKYIN